MSIEEVKAFCRSLPDVTEESSFGPDWESFRVGGRAFLHIWLKAPIPQIAVKLPPEEGEDLRERYNAVSPAYRLNKTHWNDIWIEVGFTDEQIMGWIKESYNLVGGK